MRSNYQSSVLIKNLKAKKSLVLICENCGEHLKQAIEGHVTVVQVTPIPDKRVGTQRKFTPPPTFNVDDQVIFPFLLEKT